MGGMERVASLLSNYAVRSNYEVNVICLMRESIDFKIDSSVIIHEPSFKYKGGFWAKLKIFLYLTSKLKKMTPCSALSFSEVFNPLSVLSGLLSGAKIFISDRSNPYLTHNTSTRFLRRMLYPLSDGMISQTMSAKKVASLRKYNRKIEVIPNPLSDVIDYTTSDKSKIVVSVGRLVPSKNFVSLIHMFLAADNEAEWKLWILGEGPERERIESVIRSLNLGKRVELFGAVTDINYYLSQASIFAYASISEGFPNALSEALASPLACIAYDCPVGPSDMIENGINGYLVPLNDEKLFVKHLNELMNNQNKRDDFVSNYQAHKSKYEVSHICTRYLDFIFDTKNDV